MFCVECGKEIPDAAKFCSDCGASQIVKVEEKPVVGYKTTIAEEGSARTKIFAFLICLVLAGAYIYTQSLPSKDDIIIETYCSHNAHSEHQGCGFHGYITLDDDENVALSGWWKIKTIVDSDTVYVTITCDEDDCEDESYVVMTIIIYYNGEEVVNDRRDCGLIGSSAKSCTNTVSYTKPVDEN